MRPEDRLNRVLLALLSAVMVAAGATGLARSYGAFGRGTAMEPVLGDDLRRFAAGNRAAFWAGALLAALAVAALSWRWLRVQLRTAPALAEAELAPSSPGQPATPVRAGAITSAVASDMEEHGEVVGVAARLAPTAEPFTLHLTVTVADGGRVDDIRRHLGTVALPRLRRALEVDEVHTAVRFDTAPPAGRRVR